MAMTAEERELLAYNDVPREGQSAEDVCWVVIGTGDRPQDCKVHRALGVEAILIGKELGMEAESWCGWIGRTICVTSTADEQYMDNPHCQICFGNSPGGRRKNPQSQDRGWQF